ncbi:MAG: WecB/TagA/CpsF family glycosyltransferase [Bryobacteraceae bacterium]
MPDTHIPLAPLDYRFTLGTRIDNTSYEDAAARVLAWCRQKASRYVCVANVHMVMEAYDSAEYRNIVNDAALVTPDGMPLVWSLRLMGARNPTRVYGPDLTLAVLQEAERYSIPVGFYGGTPAVLHALIKQLKSRFPQLVVRYAYSPPFGSITQEESERSAMEINDSGIQILFVGLGCPKQERWMAAHQGRVNSVMLGVGAAFDFIARTKPQAPSWMQKLGFEWLFRLLTEPRRLLRRYAKHNPRFLFLLLSQVLKAKHTPIEEKT